MAHRHELTDVQWHTLEGALPKRRGPDAIIGDRAFINAILYRAKTGCAWRDLPERYGPWQTVYNRCNAWSHRGTWLKLLKALQLEVDDDGCIIDASVVRAHQDASGGKGGSKSMRWVTLEVVSPRSSMHLSTPKGGRCTLRSLQANSTSPRLPRISSDENAQGEAFIADTGYDSDEIIAEVRKQKMKPVICPHPNRLKKPRLDRRKYRKRYLVEVYFHNIKRFRVIATRFEKNAHHYLSLVQLVSSLLWIPEPFAHLNCMVLRPFLGVTGSPEERKVFG